MLPFGDIGQEAPVRFLLSPHSSEIDEPWLYFPMPRIILVNHRVVAVVAEKFHLGELELLIGREDWFVLNLVVEVFHTELFYLPLQCRCLPDHPGFV